jgi:hypothetical protein
VLSPAALLISSLSLYVTSGFHIFGFSRHLLAAAWCFEGDREWFSKKYLLFSFFQT